MSVLQEEFERNRRAFEAQGRATFKKEPKRDKERYHGRDPILFGLSNIAGHEVWDNHEVVVQVSETEVRELSIEYHSNHHMLRKELSLEGRQSAYLMEGGHWEVCGDDPFPATLKMLRGFPVFETGLGTIVYSTSKSNSSIRRSFEMTNCKLSVLIVLFECNDSAPNESVPTDRGTVAVGSLRVGRRVIPLRRGDVIVVDYSFASTLTLNEDSRDVVLLEVDIWHPELLRAENQTVREGIEQLFPALKFKAPVNIADSGNYTLHSAVEMFVETPNSGRLYSAHPHAADYAKVLQELVSQRKRAHYTISAFVIGDRFCGKSSLIMRFADPSRNPVGQPSMFGDFCIAERGMFDPDVCPVIAEIGGPVKVKIRLRNDMSYEFPWVRNHPTEPASAGIFLCFDVTNRRSFEHLDAWMLKIQRTEESFPVKTAKVLLGLKVDRDPAVGKASTRVGIFSALLQSLGYTPDSQVVPSTDLSTPGTEDSARKVAYDEAHSFATLHGMPYVECSAKTGFAMEDALATLLHHVFRSDPRLGAELPPMPPSNEHFNSQSICVLT